jgi:hypothetical protein
MRHCCAVGIRADVKLKVKVSETSGAAILVVGIALLVTTFVVALIHLYGDSRVLPVPSLMASFGESLSPLIEAAVRVLYLGLMGWIASTVTNKGITALLKAKLVNKTTISKSQ